MQEALLQVIKLSCVRQQKSVFVNIAFALHSGEIVIVEGPNGAGKSSLLRLLAGLSTPFSGEILWQKRNIQHLREAYTKNLHYIGHTNGLKPHLTIIENLRLFAHLSCSKTKVELQTDFATVLKLLSLEHLATQPAKFLSAGLQRRIALARLFLVPKKLWVVDEPLTALDAKTQELFLTQLTIHLKHGGTAVISSHHPLPLHTLAVKKVRLPTC